MMMSAPKIEPPSCRLTVRCLSGKELVHRLPHLASQAINGTRVPLSRHLNWLLVLEQGLRQTPYLLEVRDGERTTGWLPLAYVRSLLFGRYLVSLPYLNSNGVIAEDEASRRLLIDRAVQLADELRVRHLELRHEQAIEHPALTGRLTSKVHMRLPLPDFPGPLWESFPAKVRNQVRKGEKGGLTVAWGGIELLPEFYAVFSRNMRDLGTPVYGQRLFAAILRHFPPHPSLSPPGGRGKGEGEVELCLVRAGQKPAAAALLLHGKGVTEVPSASALREYNSICANMLMYWNLLDRAVQRGQAVFDFGRSTVDCGTYKFKKQWGAVAEPAVWQYYVRQGSTGDLRPDNPRYQRLIRIWQRLPVRLTRWIGPAIVRGIP